MRCVGFAILVAVCALTAGRGLAQATRPTDTLPTIIKNLGSDVFATREAAQRELEKIPSSQVEILRDAANRTTDVEVKARLQARVSDMDFDLLMHPKPLSIGVHNATLPEVVKALNDQLHGEIIMATNLPVGRAAGAPAADPPAAPVITLRLQDVPLWEILRQVNEVAPFTVTVMAPLPSTGSSWTTFQLKPLLPGTAPPPLTVKDGMAILPSTSGNPATGNWSLRCSVYLDPRLRVGRYSSSIRVEKALDQDGRPLTWVVPTVLSTTSTSRPAPTFTISATFAAAPGITAIKELRGTATVEIQESEKTFKIDLTKGILDSVETATAKVAIERTAGDFRLTLTPPDAGSAGGPASALSGTGTPSIAILVKDADGRILQTVGAAGTNIKLNIKGNATTAEITTTDKTREVTLPIVLKDVAIPAVGGAPAAVPGLGTPAAGPVRNR